MKVRNYMAILRNLRNITQAGVSKEYVDKVCRAIQDEYAIKNSKQLPVRFLSAYEAINEKSKGLFESDVNIAAKFKKAASVALQMSTETNVPKIPGKTSTFLQHAKISTMALKKQKNALYMIDIENNDEWDYIYTNEMGMKPDQKNKRSHRKTNTVTDQYIKLSYKLSY